METLSEAENRLSIGGKKREKSNRRSSILKIKSPSRGALEDLDLNSLQETGRPSKSSRRSSGRRVSFAIKNEVKEFSTEPEWDQWPDNKPADEIHGPGQDASEYRQPASTLKGIEALLMGSIHPQGTAEQEQDEDITFKSSAPGLDPAHCQGQGLLSTLQDGQATATAMMGVAPVHGAGEITRHSDPDGPDQLEVTLCHGYGVMAGEGALESSEAAQSESNALELTVCQGVGFLPSPTSEGAERTGINPAAFLNSLRNAGATKKSEQATQSRKRPLEEVTQPGCPPGMTGSLVGGSASLGLRPGGKRRHLEEELSSGQEMLVRDESVGTVNGGSGVEQERRLSGQKGTVNGSAFIASLIGGMGTSLVTSWPGDTVSRSASAGQTAAESMKPVLIGDGEPGGDLDLTSVYQGTVLPTYTGRRDTVYDAKDVDQTVCLGTLLMDGGSEPAEPTASQDMTEEDLDLTCGYGGQILPESTEEARCEVQEVDHTECVGKLVEGQKGTLPKSDAAADMTKSAEELDLTCGDAGLIIAGSKERESTVLAAQDVEQAVSVGGTLMEAEQDSRALDLPVEQHEANAGGDLDLTHGFGGQILSGSEQRRETVYTVQEIEQTVSIGKLLEAGQDRPHEFTAQKYEAEEGEDLELTSGYGGHILPELEQRRETVFTVQEIEQTANIGKLLDPEEEQLQESTAQKYEAEDGEDLELTSGYGGQILSGLEQRRETVFTVQEIEQTANIGKLLDPEEEHLQEFTAQKYEAEDGADLELTRGYGGQILPELDQRRETVFAVQEIEQTANIGKLLDPGQEQIQESTAQKYEAEDGEDLELTRGYGGQILPESERRRDAVFTVQEIEQTANIGKLLEAQEDCTPQELPAEEGTAKATQEEDTEIRADADCCALDLGQGDLEAGRPDVGGSCNDSERDERHTSGLSATQLPRQQLLPGLSGGIGEESPPDGARVRDYSRTVSDSLIRAAPHSIALDYAVSSNSNEDFGGELVEPAEPVKCAESMNNAAAGPAAVGVASQITAHVSNLDELSVVMDESGHSSPAARILPDSASPPLTVEEFLFKTGSHFNTTDKVLIRRSSLPLPARVEQPSQRTDKDCILLMSVVLPQLALYADASAAVDEEISIMEKKLEDLAGEFNARNPALFREVQSASTAEFECWTKRLMHWRTCCGRTAKGKWKSHKKELKAGLLGMLQEKHQQLANDVHAVEESLAMADECLALLDNSNKETDGRTEKLKRYLSASEKELETLSRETNQRTELEEQLTSQNSELKELEDRRTSLASERDRLHEQKQRLEEQRRAAERALQPPQAEDSVEEKLEELKQTESIIRGLQEWALVDVDHDHALFAFIRDTVELRVEFDDKLGSVRADQKSLKSISLSAEPEDHKPYSLLTKALVETIDIESLKRKFENRASLPELLDHLSCVFSKIRRLSDEVFSIGVRELTSVCGNTLSVELSSLKAFVKFVLDFSFDINTYPDVLERKVSVDIGTCSADDVERHLSAVAPGPRYVTRLVRAANEFLEIRKSATRNAAE